MNPQKSSSVAILVMISSLGWLLAGVFGVLACFLALDARGRDVPWQILASLVLGPVLASAPIVVVLLSALKAFRDGPQESGLTKQGPTPSLMPGHFAPWRAIAVIVLAAVELLLIPLTAALTAADDDTLLLTVPLNLAVVLAILLVACLPYRRRASIALCCIHLLGIVIACVAAAVEIESVVVSGLLLMISAIALAIVGERPHAPRLAFALSTVAMIMVSFLVIALGNIGQREADGPLFAAIVVYQALFVPAGLLTLYQALRAAPSIHRAQFGLKQMLAVMAIVCFAAAAARVSYSVEHDVQIAIAFGMGALTLTGAAAVLFFGWRGGLSHSAPALHKAQVA